jgi:hypothetical protein
MDRYRVTARLEADPEPRFGDMMALAGEVAVVSSFQRAQSSAAGMRITDLTERENGRVKSGTKPILELEFELPADAVRKNRELTVREIFGGPARSVRCDLPELPFVEKATVVRTGDTKAVLTLQGRLLRRLESVLVDGSWREIQEKTDSIALVDFPLSQIAATDHVLVTTAAKEIQLVSLKDKPVVAKPVIATKPEVVEGYSGPIEVQGENLGSIAKVVFEGTELESKLQDNVLTILLVSKVTEKAAPRALILKLRDGSEAHLIVTVKPKA